MSRRSEYTDRFRTDVAYRPPRQASNPSDISGNHSSVSVAQILSLVDRATSAERRSPDYALNLQIADLVNEKKGSAPREVAMKLAKMAIPSYHKRGILASSVLDVCVKNCGYPFHLAVSRRDFLNTSVRPFGVNPPSHYSHLQNVILGMSQEWDLGLVKNSKHRDDLVNISDMVHLLQRKGYIFPEVSMEDVAALRPTDDTSKSAAELENEDREVQSAKSQELIRSGTPEDSKEANRLMSSMAGFRESRIDYHAKMAAELDKVRRKAELFEEMSQNADPETLNSDVFSESHQSLKSALPKIRHILNDKETMEEDEEAHQRILTSQESINAVLAKYNAIKSGDPNAANMPGMKQSGGSSGSGGGIASLIDIGDDTSEATSSPAPSASGDDLLGSSLGGLSLGSSSSKPMTTADILQLGTSSPKKPRENAIYTPDKALVAANAAKAAKAAAAAPPSNDSFGDFTPEGDTKTPSFASPPPSSAVPSYSDKSITVTYTVSKKPSRTELLFHLANPGAKKITNLETQFAPPRALRLELGPLSQTQIEAHQTSNPITQKLALLGDATPKLRWKINYNFGVEPRSIGGDLKSI